MDCRNSRKFPKFMDNKLSWSAGFFRGLIFISEFKKKTKLRRRQWSLSLLFSLLSHWLLLQQPLKQWIMLMQSQSPQQKPWTLTDISLKQLFEILISSFLSLLFSHFLTITKKPIYKFSQWKEWQKKNSWKSSWKTKNMPESTWLKLAKLQ